MGNTQPLPSHVPMPHQALRQRLEARGVRFEDEKQVPWIGFRGQTFVPMVLPDGWALCNQKPDQPHRIHWHLVNDDNRVVVVIQGEWREERDDNQMVLMER